MSRLFLRLILVAGAGMTAAACQGDGYGAPSGYNQPAQGYYQPAPAYYQPAPASTLLLQSRYGYSQAAPNYNPTDGRRYTTVAVTTAAERVSRRRRSAAGRLRKPVLRRLPYPHRPSVLIACARSYEPRTRLASAPASLAPSASDRRPACCHRHLRDAYRTPPLVRAAALPLASNVTKPLARTASEQVDPDHGRPAIRPRGRSHAAGAHRWAMIGAFVGKPCGAVAVFEYAVYGSTFDRWLITMAGLLGGGMSSSSSRRRARRVESDDCSTG